jgi:glycosyltransferase involved in cell wall biosynthesis
MGYRILYHHRTQALDGQRVHINAIQGALRELGHTVVEVSPLPAVEAAGAESVPTVRRRVFERIAAFAPRGVYEALELGYNVVGYRALASAIRAARPDFIYERYALNTVAGAWASSRHGVPLLLEVNSPLAKEKKALGQLLFYRGSQRLEAYTLGRASRVLAVTQVLADELRGAATLTNGKIVVVHNGADPFSLVQTADVRSSARAELGVGEADVVLGSVGFFREWHGIDLMLRACATVRSSSAVRTRLLFVGDGPAVPSLRRLAAELDLGSDVIFAGNVPHGGIPRFLAAMDIAVIPRAVEYASTLKLFEYMAAGKAIIAPSQPNLREVITDNHDAVCFTRENVQELTAAMARLIADPALQQRIGKEAQHTIDARQLTWRGNASRIIEAFEALVRARSVDAS